jgi:hypothetical protein
MTGAGLAIFGAFLGGILKGWLGGSGSTKLDKLTRKDRESEINRKARERVLAQ